MRKDKKNMKKEIRLDEQTKGTKINHNKRKKPSRICKKKKDKVRAIHMYNL